MLKTVNRVLLALAGLLLVALGAAVLVGALDLRRRWGLALPAGWPFAGAHDVLLSAAARRRRRGGDWWWPVVITVLSLLVLLALCWLLAQVRRRRLDTVLVHGGDSGDADMVLLRAGALEEAMSAEAAEAAGVEDAVVTLTGRRTAPEARVTLTLAAHSAPAAALHRLCTEALDHARSSVGLTKLPARVRLRIVRHRAERVE
ncbi:alkaline shock response membrane anchor protein AmaP [Streptomyces sp. NPDC052396]|uniref:alkaline shock response membrane anchor protein AmaP n=1 Tax=Streptomyces sp. NPDC052396 TaxID=3365689 RepID=UPI0037D4190C